MAADVERQYRRFLLVSAAATYAAAAVELLLVGHYEDVWQYIPFGLIGAGLAAVGWASWAPCAPSIRALWIAGGLAVAGSALGVVLHVKGNAEFALEIDPALALGEVLTKGLTGANPFLAPGMIALAGILAAAAGWRHPRA